MASGSGSLILSIDQGTSSSRVLLFDVKTGECSASANLVVEKSQPCDGWVEQDAEELFSSVESCLRAVRRDIDSIAAIKAVGITNQRETTIVWDKTTGVPLYNAIVWQDQRTAGIVKDLQEKLPANFSDLCGLPLDTYFSATKLKWLIENCEAVHQCVKAGNCMFGTVDTWLIWKLSGGASAGDAAVYVTDVTNASRTMLMDIATCQWSEKLKSIFEIPAEVNFPKVCSSSEIYGHIHASVADGAFEGIPIAGCLGDQQAALVGHGCLSANTGKSTFGTGCFMLFNTGTQRITSQHGLLTTVAFKFGQEDVHYALEGAVAVAGDIVKWLRDELKILKNASESEELAQKAESVEDFSVMFVPAFSGLKAPYWQADARGIILGLTYSTSREHICRAALESTCFQTKEVLDSMMQDSSSPSLTVLRVDGGMTNNKYFLQKLADILHVDIGCPELTEITALGAAYAAGKAVGVDVKLDSKVKINSPNASPAGQDVYYQRWKEAVRRCQNWHGDSFLSS